MGKWRVLHSPVLYCSNWSHGASTAYTTLKLQATRQWASGECYTASCTSSNCSHGASTAYKTVKLQGNGQVASATRPYLVLPVTGLMGLLLLTKQWRYKVMGKWRVLHGSVLYFQ
ncbi:hypothetical protein J6590_080929 [Homalodisca vitripennis]|nr:hypothetical protein J6590_080929 [Homalodisca vitripennis]